MAEPIRCSFQQAKKLVKKAVEVKRPIFMWGPPGIGKSSLVKELANEGGYGLVDIRLSQLDPTDLRGMPVIERETKTTSWYTPSFLPRKGKYLIFLDELNQANRLIQAAALELLLDRKCGDYKVPNESVLVAAGNRLDDNAFVQPLSSALENRMLHLEVEPNLENFVTWGRGKIVDDVIDFLQWKSDLLYKQTKEPAYPTPRSWEFCSQLIENEKDDKMVKSLASTAIGIGAAQEFTAWMKVYRNVDINAILNKGTLPEVKDKDASFKYAVTLAVGNAVRKGKAKGKETNLSKFLDILPREFHVLFFRNLTPQKIQELISNKAMEKYTKIVSEILD